MEIGQVIRALRQERGQTLEQIALEIGTDRAVLVTLLASVVSTDAIRQGLLAHQRMTEQYKSRVQCLLVAPDLQIDRPMFMTARVAITDMDADHLRAALVRLAKEPAIR